MVTETEKENKMAGWLYLVQQDQKKMAGLLILVQGPR